MRAENTVTLNFKKYEVRWKQKVIGENHYLNLLDYCSCYFEKEEITLKDIQELILRIVKSQRIKTKKIEFNVVVDAVYEHYYRNTLNDITILYQNNNVKVIHSSKEL